MGRSSRFFRGFRLAAFLHGGRSRCRALSNAVGEAIEVIDTHDGLETWTRDRAYGDPGVKTSRACEQPGRCRRARLHREVVSSRVEISSNQPRSQDPNDGG